MENTTATVIVLALILAAEFVNGWTDAPNAMATVVSTRVLTPGRALAMASVFNLLGTMSGTAVAATIGTGIVRAEVINIYTVGSAMTAIVLWSTLAWYYGLPTSESHALIAGLTGAGLATAGPDALLWSGWQKTLMGLLFSTFLGFIGGMGLMTVIYRVFMDRSRDAVQRIFGKAQIASAAFMAFSHGSNDGQKFIGAFTLVLMLSGALPGFVVQWWVVLLCATVMALGTAVGGWRIIRTIAMRMTRLKPVNGFAAETAAAITIELASRLGYPLSTTHTISTSIMGVASVRRASAVRWGVSRDIVRAWVLTFPVCGAIAWGTAKLAMLLFG
jgi:PiT family inorganic phosphate transporter